MNANKGQNDETKKSIDKTLLKNFAAFEKSIQDMCIKLATIQHVFGDEEFSSLMSHIESLEAAAAEKKKIIGS